MAVTRRHHDYVVQTLPEASEGDSRKIARWVRDTEKPYWTYLNNMSVNLIETSDKHVLLYIYEPGKDNQAVEIVKNISKKYYTDLISILIEKGNQKGLELINSLGLPPQSSNLFVVYKSVDSSVTKFIGQPSSLSSQVALETFIDACLDQHHEKYYNSEEVPSSNLFEGLETLVGKNIEQKVFADKEKYHIVFFYDSQTANQIPVFHKISKKLQLENIKFYIYNSDKNESKDVDPLHHGSVVLYSNKKKMILEKAFFFYLV